MKLHAYTPAALFALLLSTLLPSLATNPPGNPGSTPNKCDGDSSSGSSTGTSPGVGAASLDWRANLGLARYPKPSTFTNLAQTAYESDGTLPSFGEMRERFFSSNPLQDTQVHIQFNIPRLTEEFFRPSTLSIQSEAIFEKLVKPAANGLPEYVHQVVTNDGFTLIEPFAAPATGFRVRTWERPATLPAKVDGYYSTAALQGIPPLGDFTFKRPDGATGFSELLYIQKENTGVSGARVFTEHIVETPSGAARPDQLTTTTYQGEGTGGALLRREVLTYSARGSKEWDYTIDRTVETADMNTDGSTGALRLTNKTREVYKDFSTTATGGEPGMKRLLSRTEAFGVPGQMPRTTTYTYVDDPANRSMHGRLVSTVNPDGSWTYTETQSSPNSPVVVVTTYASWGDIPLSDKENARKTVTTTGATTSSSVTTIGGQRVEESRTTLSYGSESITQDSKWDGQDWLTTTTTYFGDNAPAPNSGRIRDVIHPDGTQTRYSYATDASGRLVVTRREGDIADTVGTEEKTTCGRGNIAIAQESKDIASGLLLERWDTDLSYNGGFDRVGRPIRRIFNGDTDDFDETTYACCGLEFRRDRDGTATRYDRDPLKRVYRKTVTPGLGSSAFATATHTAIAGLTTTTTQSYGSSAPVFLGSVTRSMDGLATTSVAPSRKSDNPADRVVTRTLTDPATRTTTESYQAGAAWNDSAAATVTRSTSTYLDGRTHTNSGDGIPATTFTYATHAVNGGGITTTANAAGRVTTTLADMLGRTISATTPGGGTTAYTYFPATAAPGRRGKLASMTDADQVATTYGYDGRGDLTTTTRQVPSGPGGALASQVTTTTRGVLPAVTLQGVAFGTALVRTTTINGITVSTSYQAATGFITGTRALNGGDTVTIRPRPQVAGGGTPDGILHAYTIHPNGTRTHTVTTHGRVSLVEKLPPSSSAAITATSYAYDPRGRLLTVTDARTGTTTDDPGGDGYADTTESGNVLATRDPHNTLTTYAYDLFGRVTATTTGGSASYTSYYPDGAVKARWGARTYPVFNLYNAHGQLVEMRTYKDLPLASATSAGLDLANTPAYAATQWLYHANTGLLVEKRDAANKGVGYTYTPAGRLLTRTWARGTTTTYSYSQGLLTGIDYSDSTPDVTISYDTFGRPLTQSNGVASTTFTYDPATLAMNKETVSYDRNADGTPELTRVLDRSQDSIGRDTGYSLHDANTGETSAAYTYSSASGRLETVSGNGPGTFTYGTFTYGYEPGSNLLKTITHPGLQSTQPTLRVTNTWAPDRDVLLTKANELVSGSTVTNVSSITYSVNPIGQRTDATRSGAITAGTAWAYDDLGQVTSADDTNPAADRAYQYDSIGNRQRAAAGTVDSQDPSATVYTANALNQYTAVGTFAPSYDADGNQVNAQVLPPGSSSLVPCTLQWDAENRLRAATVNGTTVSYLYDAQSRLVSRTEGTATTYYLYNGWNVTAEYTQSGTSPVSLSKTHLWGLDLSGALQGAGGVGGLLASKGSTGVVRYPIYDGNGNITRDVGPLGATLASFEYDPFGNAVTNTDTTGQSPYRFSTKPQDPATGLYYYGYRWYNPVTGRWPGRDPIGEEGGLNLYGFVGNDGIDRWDLLGLDSVMVINAMEFTRKKKICEPGTSVTDSTEIPKTRVANCNGGTTSGQKTIATTGSHTFKFGASISGKVFGLNGGYEYTTHFTETYQMSVPCKRKQWYERSVKCTCNSDGEDYTCSEEDALHEEACENG